MMDVREMNVPMNGCFVPVWVGMRLVAVPLEVVCVQVVRIVPMRMGMLSFFVSVLVFMTFAQMQPKTERHQQCGNTELHRDGFTKEKHRESSAIERSNREIGTGPRRSQVP